MTDSSSTAPTAHPRFRRGTVEVHPSELGCVPIAYRSLPVPKAEGAWRSLVMDGSRHLVRSDRIADAMGLPRRDACLYRRLFDAFGLGQDVRGRYDTTRFSVKDNMFDHGNIEDGDPEEHSADYLQGYAGYTDWADLNTPAEFYVNSSDPEALTRALEHAAVGQPPTAIRVACRRVVGDTIVSRCGDNELPSVLRTSGRARVSDSTLWQSRWGGTAWEYVDRTERVSLGVDGAATSTSFLLPHQVRLSVQGWLPTEATPPTVVVITTQPTPPIEGRSPETGRCRRTVRSGEITWHEVAEDLGVSRASAFRWLQKAEKEGRAEQVARGRYRVS